MTIRMDNIVETVEYDNLIYDLYPEPEVFSVELAAGSGILERGTLLAKAQDGTYSMFGEGEGTANAVLCDPVELSSDGKVIGQAYRTGHFAQNILKVKSGATITEADKEALRDVGILLSESV